MSRVNSELATTPPPGEGPAAAAHRTVFVFDAEDEAPPARRRRRGRPRGTLDPLMADQRPVTADDLRFLSAFAQGVDPRQAARSYLMHNQHNDGRSALGYARLLLARLAARAQEHPERELAVAVVQQLQRRLADALRPARRKGAAGAAGEGADQGVTDVVAKPSAEPVAVRAAPAAATQTAPTLEEFAAQFPEDMYSEAELLELYSEAFPAIDSQGQGGAVLEPHPAAGHPAGGGELAHRLDILEWLAAHLAVPLEPHSPLVHWLEPTFAQSLRAAPLGLTTVGQLAGWINREGAQFWRQVPGLGQERARRMLRWIAERETLLGVRLRASLRALVEPVQPLTQVYVTAPALGTTAGQHAAGAAGRLVPTVVAAPQVPAERRDRQRLHALVPLEQFDWPDALAGADGYLRAAEPSLLLHGGRPARDDREALAHFIRYYVDERGPSTARAYRSALERFVLWAVLERKRALSSMTREDFYAFRDFLYAPPAHWCGQARVMKYCEEWRPLRGPQSPKAVRQTLDVLQLLYRWWHDHAYLRGNPARRLQAVPAQPAAPQPAPASAADRPAALMDLQNPSAAAVAVPAVPDNAPLDASRSFAREDLVAMDRTFHSLPDGTAKRRLRAILSLFLESGLRRSEVQNLVLGKVTPMRDEGNSLSVVRKMEVLGKGRRRRIVPILDSTLLALQEHHRDRQQLIAEGKLPHEWALIPPEQTPLLSVLRCDTGSRSRRRGLAPASAARAPSSDGRLEGKTLYGILRSFFRQVAAQLRAQGAGLPGQADFERASTHWLRHTFALQYMAANPTDLAGLQAILGHKHISTTGVYLQFGSLAQRARGIGRMEKFFGSESPQEGDVGAEPEQGAPHPSA